jgi:hypothetical protein
MHAKQANCEQCKNEYALELQKTNNFQSDHYTKSMPEIFSVGKRDTYGVQNCIVIIEIFDIVEKRCNI